MEGLPTPAPVDASLAARIRDGNSAAETELVNLFHQRAYLMACARIRDREIARDLAQDAMVAVILAFRNGQLRDPEKLPHFVVGTARNIINGYLRTRQRRKETELTGTEAACFDAEAKTERDERLRIVSAALDEMSADDQRLLMMVLVDGMKPGDIAARMKLSPESVRTRKTRAIKRLMGHLEIDVTKTPGRLHSSKGKA